MMPVTEHGMTLSSFKLQAACSVQPAARTLEHYAVVVFYYGCAGPAVESNSWSGRWSELFTL
jgi:hypothetical protein